MKRLIPRDSHVRDGDAVKAKRGRGSASPELERAIEPDECFYLTNEPLIRGKEEFNFEVDPPPDLGIEVNISSSSRRRMPIYAALGVPEVWRFSRDHIVIHRLAGDGTYQIAAHSA